MITTEYVPLNTKVYVRKIIELEAENKALRKTIKIYNHLLHKHMKNKKTIQLQSDSIIIKPNIVFEQEKINSDLKPVLEQNQTRIVNQNDNTIPDDDLHHLAEKYCETQNQFNYNSAIEHKNIKQFLHNF